MTSPTLCTNYTNSYNGVNGITLALAWIRKANSVYRQRKALECMTQRHLDDIGITQYDAEREAKRSFWDLP